MTTTETVLIIGLVIFLIVSILGVVADIFSKKIREFKEKQNKQH